MFFAKLRTLASSELTVPIAANSLSDALKAAEATRRSLASAACDVRLVSIEDATGKALIWPSLDDLPRGWSEVTWRARYPTEDAEEAAALARIQQANPASLLSVFEVRDSSGNVRKIDLQSPSDFAH